MRRVRSPAMGWPLRRAGWQRIWGGYWLPTIRSPENQRFAKHLLHEYDRLFLYLNCPGLEATNWRGEQAIRPAVVARKVWDASRARRFLAGVAGGCEWHSDGRLKKRTGFGSHPGCKKRKLEAAGM